MLRSETRGCLVVKVIEHKLTDEADVFLSIYFTLRPNLNGFIEPIGFPCVFKYDAYFQGTRKKL